MKSKYEVSILKQYFVYHQTWSTITLYQKLGKGNWYFSNTVAKKFSHFQIFVPIFFRVHLEPAKRVRNNCDLSSHFPFCTFYGFTGCKGFTKLCIYRTSNSRYPKGAVVEKTKTSSTYCSLIPSCLEQCFLWVLG